MNRMNKKQCLFVKKEVDKLKRMCRMNSSKQINGENKMYDDNDKNEIELELDTYETEVDNKIWIDSLITNIDLEDL